MEHLIQRSQIELMELALPKWPMMKVTGDRVTKEQAKEIIRRTDSFLSSPCPEFSDNEEWEKIVVSKLCLKHGYGEHVSVSMSEVYELAKTWKSDWGYVDTAYIENHWIYSSSNVGPYGWCHPDGEIGYIDNIGKWPNTSVIYDDCVRLSNAFPFLDLAITLYNLESCEVDEPNFKPVVSMLVNKGKVTLIDPRINPNVHGDAIARRRSEEETIEQDHSLPFDKELGIGIPKEWIDDWADEEG